MSFSTSDWHHPAFMFNCSKRVIQKFENPPGWIPRSQVDRFEQCAAARAVDVNFGSRVSSEQKDLAVRSCS